MLIVSLPCIKMRSFDSDKSTTAGLVKARERLNDTFLEHLHVVLRNFEDIINSKDKIKRGINRIDSSFLWLMF